MIMNTETKKDPSLDYYKRALEMRKAMYGESLATEEQIVGDIQGFGEDL